MWKAVAARAHKAGMAGFAGLAVFAVACLLSVAGVWARSLPATGAAAPVALAALPPEGRQTWLLIRRGGPFAYAKDGTVFGNRERRLPLQMRGYYREYTVSTPGAPGRGARRIVCGGGKPRLPDACYYSGDHYGSFREIVE